MTAPSKDMQMAVNSALDQYRMIRAREQMLMPSFMAGAFGAGGMSPGLDAKRHQSWAEFGYPSGLFFIDFFKLYSRGGIAAGAVNKLAGRCWNTNPWLTEGDKDEKDDEPTAWEESLKPVLRRGRLWRAFAEADKRRLVGRYSGLILRIRDDQPLNMPVNRSAKRGLLEVVPAWAGSLIPVEFDMEEKSPTYGEPKMWRYRQPNVGSNGAKDVDVHPDRVFILGSWRSDSIGFLEPVFNNFVNLEKTEGGSGESILKNAARTIHVNFDGTVDLRNLAAMYGVGIDELQERFNDAAREVNQGNDILFVTQGATANPMVANVPDPKPIYEVNLQTVAAGVDIPSKILVGNQTGERASTEDEAYMNRRCQSRQNNELVYEIIDFFEKLISLGVIEPAPGDGEFQVLFHDLTEPTLGDKLDNANKMADINQKVTANGMGAEVFSRKQILGVTGMSDDVEDPEAREKELADRLDDQPDPEEVPEEEEDPADA